MQFIHLFLKSFILSAFSSAVRNSGHCTVTQNGMWEGRWREGGSKGGRETREVVEKRGREGGSKGGRETGGRKGGRETGREGGRKEGRG